MNIDSSRLSADQQELVARLAASRACMLERAQTRALDLAALREIADREADLALSLYPMPLDPAEHVLAAHRHARPYLERLDELDASVEVVADATHRYTPRKILRRVLDHALDHLNQIEQWLTWQIVGTPPIATDGWASSAETLEEDWLPLSAADLRAWLWRIDLTVALVAQRARHLHAAQLDWMPPAPDGGWNLRQMLHHLASSELYYAVWMEEALPDEPVARYLEANRRFGEHAYQALLVPQGGDIAYFDDDAHTTSAEQIIRAVLLAEQGAGVQEHRLQ